MKKRHFAEFLFKMGIIALAVWISWLTIDIIRFPESYITTWKYQLEQKVKSGDADAIEYYNDTYTANGRELFE